MSNFQHNIFNKLKNEQPAKPAVNDIFSRIKAAAADSVETSAPVSKDAGVNYRKNIFQSLSAKPEVNPVAARIFDKLKNVSIRTTTKKAALFVSSESITELQRLAEFLPVNDNYAWFFIFDEVGVEYRQDLNGIFANKASLEFDYKLDKPEYLVRDYDLIAVLSPDEFSHRLAIEVEKKEKIAVSTMTVQGNSSTGRHYHADNVEKLLQLLPNIMK